MLPIILYENLYREGTLTPSGTYNGYDVDNIMDYKTYTKWKADNTSNPYIDLELSGSESPNCVAIFNHNFDSIGGTIKLQYDNSGWVDLVTITPTGLNCIIQTFTAHASTKFRLQFTSPTDEPEFAVIFLGSYIEFPYPPDAPTVPMIEQISAQMEITEAGHTLPALISHHPITINHRWSNLQRSFFTNTFKPFYVNHARYLIPFFYAWDLTNRSEDLYYVTLDPGYRMQESLTVLSLTDSIELNMRGVSSDANYNPLNES